MVEAPEPPHHHHNTGLPWFDFIVPVAVLCISIASLLTSLQSEKSMHALVEQNKRLVDAQSTPLLMLDTSNLDDGKPVISMTLRNVGTGPARIAWFHVADPEGVSYNGGTFYERLAKADPHITFISEQITSTLMRSGDERSVFKWAKPDGSATLAEWQTLNSSTRFKLHASACYCSVFDECRTTEFGDSRPKPVASCDPASSGGK
jgi:hypothetical protein